MDPSRVAHRVLLIASVGQALSGLESLVCLKEYAPDSILRGRAAAQDSSFVPLKFRRWIDRQEVVAYLHGFNAALPLFLLISDRRRPAIIIASSFGVAAGRMLALRNPYGRDGSDQLQDLIYGMRLVTALIPDPNRSDDLFLRAVNAHLCVSYLTAGLAKLISAKWISGQTLGLVMRTDLYGGTWFARVVHRWPAIGRLVTWSTITWETLFPLIYLTSPRIANANLILVKLFHLGTAQTMGLPRFVWAFSAGHEAVKYVISTRRRGAI
jgi:hypothetical protein